MLGNPDGGTFVPIPQLNRTDADVSIHVLASSQGFTEPVNDPWFQSLDLMDPDVQPRYVKQNQLGVVGCIEQHQFCNQRTGKCGPLTGLSMLYGDQSGLELNFAQQTIMKRLLESGVNNHISSTVPTLGSAFMDAQQYAFKMMSLPVPDDQWIREFQHWFSIILGNIQRTMIEYVAGPEESAMAEYVNYLPTNETWMCKNQVVRREDYSSFSILGIAIIILIGALFIVANLTTDRIIDRIRRNSPDHAFKTKQWMLFSFFHMQRMIFEGRGIGNWSRFMNEVPVTEKGQYFSYPTELSLSSSSSSSSSTTKRDLESGNGDKDEDKELTGGFSFSRASTKVGDKEFDKVKVKVMEREMNRRTDRPRSDVDIGTTQTR
jgi:hypothetical protein